MLVGYVRVSKSDGSQVLDLQKDALKNEGVPPSCIYEDYASGKQDNRVGIEACLKALREGDTLIVWKLDRLGRDLKHLIDTVRQLESKGIGFKVLTGQGANIDTNTSSGRLIFGIFASLAEFERDLISERTKAGLNAARARGRRGGRPFKMTVPKLKMAQTLMTDRNTQVKHLCQELGVTRQTLYRHIAPDGTLREEGKKLLAK